MRLTVKLCGTRYAFHRKNLWKRKGKMNEPLPVIPLVLKKKGIEIVDPSLKQPKAKWQPPVDDLKWWTPPKLEELPNYNKEPAYIFHHQCHLLEGEKQAQILTKSQCFSGLPPCVNRLVGTFEIPNQDMLIQRFIMLSQVWNPTQDRLPKRIDKSNVGYHFPREYGIHREKSAQILMQNLIRLCQSLTWKFPAILDERRLLRHHYLRTHYHFHENHLINIQGHIEWLLLTNKSLDPFGKDDVIDTSVSYTLPNIYPISPTIDLDKNNCYTVDNNTGWLSQPTHSLHHTLFIVNKNYWPTEQRNASALMYCFGHAISQARRRFGENVQTLPEPIAIQCIHMDFCNINFVFLQLNTLNFDDDNGVKNLVWFDRDNKMFKKILPRPWLGPDHKHTRYESYDPSVFKKFLAVYLNGLTGTSSVQIAGF